MAIPVSLMDAKRQLRIGFEDESQDDEIPGFIADAAAWVERYTGHILTARDVKEEFGSFGRLRLRAWPVKPGAPLTVSYVDANGMTTVPGARVFAANRSVVVEPALGSRWPSLPRGGRVIVKVRAGYEEGDPVPGNLRRAMLVLIGAYDADREGGEILQNAEASARSLCRDFRARNL